jgi:hypothetical protein
MTKDVSASAGRALRRFRQWLSHSLSSRMRRRLLAALSAPNFARFALAANLVGSILLFYSFQATSSDFKLTTQDLAQSEQKYAICAGDLVLASADTRHNTNFGTGENCPEKAKSAAIVNTEHPAFITAGFILLVFGFVLQYLAIPSSKQRRTQHG